MYNPKEVENNILEYWRNEGIYEKVKEASKGRKKFYFLDGPPYATGYIHIGTAMNKIIKDFYIRYFRMSGFDVWDQPGYDTHGVPIEHKVEKKLGFKTKQEIDKFGTENFIRECRTFATEFIGTMSQQFSNLGVWMDWEHSYLTLDNEYIEGAWYTFKKAYEKNLLYQGVYPVHVCTRCGTGVAYNEIEYDSVTDTSIFVKFKLKGKNNEYLIIWTTTPWTLPSNTGVMANPEADYVRFETDGEIWIFALNLLEKLKEKFGIEGKIIETVKGKDLEGTEYMHPMEDLFEFQKDLKNAHRVVLSEKYVTLEDGTGLVHTAPGHGQEDYEVGKENNLPIINPLRPDGRFNEKSGKFSGIHAKEANSLIIDELRDRNLIVKEEKITHDYPFCWRCETPLLLMTMPQWFFRVTSIREKLLSENEKINWVPEWAKSRFRNWLESLGDWPVSRQRYWGIPLPIWVCDKCGEIVVIGSRDELPQIPEDFHKPYIDKISWTCKKCKGTMKRVPDILDVWFDSGVAPWASLGYPKNKELFEKMWPTDFILEGPDQIRGWWNSLMITGILTFDRRPFDNVLFHGFVMDNHGIKMSKSKGNVVTSEEIIEKHGRDLLRLYFLSGTPWDDYYFSWQDIDELAKSFVIIRNTFNFTKTYAKTKGSPENLKIEDKWILSRLNNLIKKYEDSCRKFRGHVAVQATVDFIINDFSRWYIKLIRNRVWPLYIGEDKESAFYTLFTVTESLSRLMAPIAPFFAEEIYKEIINLNSVSKEKSVHLLSMPIKDESLIDENLEYQMDIAKEIVEACASARQEAGIKLRWPIREVVVFSTEEKVRDSASELSELLLQMCNTKSVNVTNEQVEGEFSVKDFSHGKVMVKKGFDEELLEEAMLRELVRKIQSMRKEANFNVSESIRLCLKSDEKTEIILNRHFDELKSEVGAKNITIGNDGDRKGTLGFEAKTIEISFEKD
jgi:isoleucyl-tRNA synthetase